MSVYQISQYPFREKRIEKALGSQPGGTKGSKAFGNEILHPGGGGEIVVGSSRTTIAARPGSSAEVRLLTMRTVFFVGLR